MNSCQLCTVEKLVFDMVPIYCTPCGSHIAKNAYYYVYVAEEHKHAICAQCFRAARGKAIEIERQMVPKAQLNRNKNDEEIKEKVTFLVLSSGDDKALWEVSYPSYYWFLFVLFKPDKRIYVILIYSW